MEQMTLAITGMSCGHCLNAVNAALAGLPGVSIVSVRIGRADLSYDPVQVTRAQILGAIEEAGYTAQVAA